MAEPKKNSLKNTLKEEVLENKTSEKETKPKTSRSSNTKKDGAPTVSFIDKINNFFSFLSNERFQKIFGLTLLLLSVYSAIAFTSFVFTWQVDQDKVIGNLFSSDVVVTNWLGKFGALLAHIFVHKWFGIASYIFSFLAFVTGLQITFNIRLFSLGKTYAYSLFFLVFSSLLLAYVFSNGYFYLGGAFGFTLINKLNAILGFIGSGVLLLFSFVVFLVIAFNVSFDLSKKEKPPTTPNEPEKKK